MIDHRSRIFRFSLGPFCGLLDITRGLAYVRAWNYGVIVKDARNGLLYSERNHCHRLAVLLGPVYIRALTND